MVQPLPAADQIPEDINHYGFKTIPDILAYTCKNFGPKPAYTSFGRTLDYNELDRLSASFAVYLQKRLIYSRATALRFSFLTLFNTRSCFLVHYARG